MKIAIIAEKPSVGTEIARIVGASEKRDGYVQGNGYIVTWAFGHLVGLAMPSHYGLNGFNREHLPILPKPFELIARQIRTDKKFKPDTGALKQLKTIKTVFNSCDSIIVATDAGREGELIFRYIYQFLGCTKPFDRLWISSLTDKAIQEGLRKLKPGSNYDLLYIAAKARSEADWLVGINASQAFSIAAGSGTYSLGRVQTPTLAMVCSRYLENRCFTPEKYWQLKLRTEKKDGVFSAVTVERYSSQEVGNSLLLQLKNKTELTVQSVENKEINQEPPLLYDLTALQKSANSLLGFSADKTLTIAQQLYEAKLITYPRTGSRYIPEDVFETITTLIGVISSHKRFGAYASKLSTLNKLCVDDTKITDHHALLITDNSPIKLSVDESLIYEMIAGRMLEVFSQKCIKELTTLTLNCDGVLFVVTGTVIRQAGWRDVLNVREEGEEFAVLPALSTNEVLPLKGIELLEKQTKPKALHTESSLLSAMESAGKELENEAERLAMKDSGIGTPATRAAIIETLLTRDYIRREKKSLVPTEKGLLVYDAVKDKLIADVQMTGMWENTLAKIEAGEMPVETFRKAIEIHTEQITGELLDLSISKREECVCPVCKSAKMLFYDKVVKCSNTACSLAVFRTKSEKKLSDEQILELLTTGKTAIIKGFKSKNGKSFDASLVFNEQFQVVFEFTQKKSVLAE